MDETLWELLQIFTAQLLMCSTQGAEAGLVKPVPGERVKGRQNAGVSPGSSPTRHKALPTVCAREPEGVTSRGPAGGEEGQQYTCSYICFPDPWDGDGSRTERRKGRAWESEGIRSEMLVLWTEGTRWPASRHSLSTELLTQALVPTLPRAGPEGCPDPLGTHWPRPPGPASWPRPASLICWNYVPSGSSVPILSPWGPGTSLESCSVPPLLNTCLKGRNYA